MKPETTFPRILFFAYYLVRMGQLRHMHNIQVEERRGHSPLEAGTWTDMRFREASGQASREFPTSVPQTEVIHRSLSRFLQFIAPSGSVLKTMQHSAIG